MRLTSKQAQQQPLMNAAKRKEEYVELRKRTKSSTAMAKSKGASDSKKPAMSKCALKLLGSTQTLDFELLTQSKGGKNGDQEREK